MNDSYIDCLREQVQKSQARIAAHKTCIEMENLQIQEWQANIRSREQLNIDRAALVGETPAQPEIMKLRIAL